MSGWVDGLAGWKADGPHREEGRGTTRHSTGTTCIVMAGVPGTPGRHLQVNQGPHISFGPQDTAQYPQCRVVLSSCSPATSRGTTSSFHIGNNQSAVWLKWFKLCSSQSTGRLPSTRQQPPCCSPSGHWQVPFTHVRPRVHWMSQAPQFFESDSRLVSQPGTLASQSVQPVRKKHEQPGQWWR